MEGAVRIGRDMFPVKKKVTNKGYRIGFMLVVRSTTLFGSAFGL